MVTQISFVPAPVAQAIGKFEAEAAPLLLDEQLEPFHGAEERVEEDLCATR